VIVSLTKDYFPNYKHVGSTFFSAQSLLNSKHADTICHRQNNYKVQSDYPVQF